MMIYFFVLIFREREAFAVFILQFRAGRPIRKISNTSVYAENKIFKIIIDCFSATDAYIFEIQLMRFVGAAKYKQ